MVPWLEKISLCEELGPVPETPQQTFSPGSSGASGRWYVLVRQATSSPRLFIDSFLCRLCPSAGPLLIPHLRHSIHRDCRGRVSLPGRRRLRRLTLQHLHFDRKHDTSKRLTMPLVEALAATSRSTFPRWIFARTLRFRFIPLLP